MVAFCVKNFFKGFQVHEDFLLHELGASQFRN